MSETRIMIVEDEGIIAEDLRDSLENLGYTVPLILCSAQGVVEKAEEIRPHLVLMDIMLQGEIDGIELAGQLRSRLNIPVVYLTAYADPKTLERAKTTQPFGYIVKPFNNRELHTNIEIALYNHGMEMKLQMSFQWLSSIVTSIAEGIVVANARHFITFLNPVAEEMMGIKCQEAMGRSLREIFRFEDDSELPGIYSDDDIIIRGENRILLSQDRRKIPVDYTLAPLRDRLGNGTGLVLIIRDVSSQWQMREALRKNDACLSEFAGKLCESLNMIQNSLEKNLRSYWGD